MQKVIRISKIFYFQLLFITIFLFSVANVNGEGLFYKLPADGSWVTYKIKYTYKSQGVEQSGEQTMKLASVGKVTENNKKCRWIEFYNTDNSDGTERFWIRKLLISERYLKAGENPTAHVIRGWTKQEFGEVEKAVPVHGRWAAYLAGKFNDEKKLPQKLIESKIGKLKSKGLAGWIEFSEGDIKTKVTMEMRIYKKALFGVLSTRMLFEVKSGDSPPYSIDAMAELIDSGVNAQSALPKFN